MLLASMSYTEHIPCLPPLSTPLYRLSPISPKLQPRARACVYTVYTVYTVTLCSFYNISLQNLSAEEQEFWNGLFGELLQPMAAGGLGIGRRRYKLKTYEDCFTGGELVDWILAQTSIPIGARHEASELGQLMMDDGLLVHTKHTKQFCDNAYLCT